MASRDPGVDKVPVASFAPAVHETHSVDIFDKILYFRRHLSSLCFHTCCNDHVSTAATLQLAAGYSCLLATLREKLPVDLIYKVTLPDEQRNVFGYDSIRYVEAFSDLFVDAVWPWLSWQSIPDPSE
jgi:hypothetical protein